VIEPWDVAGTPLAPVIRLLKSKYPSVPMGRILRSNRCGASREAFALTQAGVDAVVVHGVGDVPSTLRAIVDQACTGRACAAVLRAIQPHAPVDAVALNVRWDIPQCANIGNRAIDFALNGGLRKYPMMSSYFTGNWTLYTNGAQRIGIRADQMASYADRMETILHESTHSYFAAGEAAHSYTLYSPAWTEGNCVNWGARMVLALL
jgi:hypothetical protein